MKVIKEYFLGNENAHNQTLYLPINAEIVNVQKGDLVTLYVLTDVLEHSTELRTFRVCMTSQRIYEDNIKYLGSFKSDLGMQHVIEIL